MFPLSSSTGKVLIIIGGFILIIGSIIYLFGNKLTWFGNLPGDIRIERENFKLYFPITTMILISIFISLIMSFVKRLM